MHNFSLSFLFNGIKYCSLNLKTIKQRNLQFYSMLASISTDYARLVSGGWLTLTEQDWLPAGKLRGVSLFSIFVRHKSPPHGFARRNDSRFTIHDSLLLLDLY